MHLLIASDKFKHTFTSKQIAQIIAKNLKQLGHTSTIIPMSDGGEGFLDAIEPHINAERIYDSVPGPLFSYVDTYFLFDKKNKTAYIELAKTGSLDLIPPEKRNPMNTTTYGLGMQIRTAIYDYDAKNIFIGLGGSSTTDFGLGMLAALGFYAEDENFNPLEPIGKNLKKVRHFRQLNSLPKVNFFACVDVDNPLFGPNGAAYVYAPQKGATPEQVEELDQGLRNVWQTIEKLYRIKLYPVPGDGAAGGLGAAIRIFLGGKIIPGAKFIADLANIDEAIQKADFVITGEGKFDEQTHSGKVVWEILLRANKYQKPVLIIAGQCQAKPPKNAELICLFNEPIDIETAKKLTPAKLEESLTKFIKSINK